MKKTTLYIVFFSFIGYSQSKEFDKLLTTMLNKTIPALRVADVNLLSNYVFLDARELKEYEVSHIPKAVYIGFENFSIENVLKRFSNKTTTIIVYCSIGVRSERIVEKLIKHKYKNVYNLYGGIFEWKNQSRQLVNLTGERTNRIHIYSQKWSEWIKNGIKALE